MKLSKPYKSHDTNRQPPSGGCVLKPCMESLHSFQLIQPPSGGCVLKPTANGTNAEGQYPAAFRRLCVETSGLSSGLSSVRQPPSGGCVLKLSVKNKGKVCFIQPPSGGCVLKQCQAVGVLHKLNQPPSGGCVLKRHIWACRLLEGKPAAFRRLCVETLCSEAGIIAEFTSRLQAAVC